MIDPIGDSIRYLESVEESCAYAYVDAAQLRVLVNAYNRQGRELREAKRKAAAFDALVEAVKDARRRMDAEIGCSGHGEADILLQYRDTLKAALASAEKAVQQESGQ